MICGLQILILSSVGLQIRRNGNKAKMRFLSSNLPFGLRMQKYDFSQNRQNKFVGIKFYSYFCKK